MASFISLCGLTPMHDYAKMAVKKSLPRCIAFYDRIPIDSLTIPNSNAMHFGKKFLAAILSVIDLLAILRKSLDRALFLYNFIREVRSSGVRGSITIMHIRKFFKLHHNIVRFRFFPE